MGRGHGGAALPAVAAGDGRPDVGARGADLDLGVGVGVVGVAVVAVGGADGHDAGVSRGVVDLGRAVVARRGQHEDAGVGRGVHGRLLAHAAHAAAQAEVDHAQVVDVALGDELIDAGHLVGRIALAIRVHGLAHVDLGVGGHADGADAVVGVGRHDPGHVGAVAVVVGAAGLEHPAAVGRVEAGGDELAGQVGVVEVDPGVHHAHGVVGRRPRARAPDAGQGPARPGPDVGSGLAPVLAVVLQTPQVVGRVGRVAGEVGVVGDGVDGGVHGAVGLDEGHRRLG